MNYEVQNALSKKVDDWQFHSLNQEVQELKNSKRNLEERIGQLEGKLSNYYSATDQIIVAMAESDNFDDGVVERLYQIRQYL